MSLIAEFAGLFEAFWSESLDCVGAIMAESIRPAGVVVDAALLQKVTCRASAQREIAGWKVVTHLVSRCPTGRKNRVETESSFPLASRN